MPTERLAIIGNGMASVRLAEALVRRKPGRFEITIIGAERQPGYNRVLLSALMAGDVQPADIILRETSWYRENGIRLISGDPVISVDIVGRIARLQSGLRASFDQCVFATGSDAIRLPVPGMNKPGVLTFRDLNDVDVMENAASSAKRVAVIGGGLLGIEAAYGLAKRGADVTLVHVMDKLMERQLDATAAAFVSTALARKGVKVLLSHQTAMVYGEVQAEGLQFADGTRLAADLVVCAVGIRPNAGLAKSAGLAVNRGIIVDDIMQTSVPGFHAIGECAEHRGIAYGLVEPVYAQAETLAANLCEESAAFEGMVLATNLKVSGVPVFSAGDFIGAEGTQCAVLENRSSGIYRKLVYAGPNLVGCVMVGDAEDGLWYLDLIRRGVDVSSMRHTLIHGRDFVPGPIAVAAA